MPVTAMAIGAALGLAKSELVDAPKEKRDRALQAATARYSPWTGMTPKDVKTADPFGSTLQGGASGLAQGQNIQMSQYMKDNPWAIGKVNYNFNTQAPSGGGMLSNSPWSGFNGSNPYSSQ